MAKAAPKKKDKDYDVRKQIAEVDKVFRSIENDQDLPTFAGFFMECIVLDIAENVNLKSMYPKVYKQLNTILKNHSNEVMALRR